MLIIDSKLARQLGNVVSRQLNTARNKFVLETKGSVPDENTVGVLVFCGTYYLLVRQLLEEVACSSPQQIISLTSSLNDATISERRHALVMQCFFTGFDVLGLISLAVACLACWLLGKLRFWKGQVD